MTNDEQDNTPQQSETEAHHLRAGSPVEQPETEAHGDAPAAKPVEEIRSRGPVTESETEAHARHGAPAEKPVEELRSRGPVEEPETEAHAFPIEGSDPDRPEHGLRSR